MESGIFYVINHGLSEELTNEFFGQMEKFFALPRMKKRNFSGTKVSEATDHLLKQ